MANNCLFISIPPANPVRLPDAPMTLWHGIIIPIGLFPFAAPTARADLGLPIRFACSPYVMHSPYVIFKVQAKRVFETQFLLEQEEYQMKFSSH